MNFTTTEKIYAFPANWFNQNANQARNSFGQNANDRDETYKVFAAHYDDIAKTRIRAGRLGHSIVPIELTDGRLAVRALWTNGFVNAAQNASGNSPWGQITELTEAELISLTPVIEEEL